MDRLRFAVAWAVNHLVNEPSRGFALSMKWYFRHLSALALIPLVSLPDDIWWSVIHALIRDRLNNPPALAIASFGLLLVAAHAALQDFATHYNDRRPRPGRDHRR